MRTPLIVPVRRVSTHSGSLPLPRYWTRDSAGLDLHADIEKDLVLHPMERTLIPTGIAMAIPLGYEGQVRPRSGIALYHGITVLNSPGTVDADYRGEIKILLINLSQEPYTIRRGDRVAQIVITPVAFVELREVAELD